MIDPDAGAGSVDPLREGMRTMNDLFRLNLQHALVTGASSGLGRHFASVPRRCRCAGHRCRAT